VRQHVVALLVAEPFLQRGWQIIECARWPEGTRSGSRGRRPLRWPFFARPHALDSILRYRVYCSPKEVGMDQETLRIGEVAARAGVNVQTLRYYERRGLLEEPDRRPSGYRTYPPDAVRVVRFIKRAQDLGFTLREVEELLRLREQRPARRAQVRALALAKIADIDRKTRGLQAMRESLTVLVDSCACRSRRLECPILEALEEAVE
jgi:MerR family transcriptional regulator, mercuric resistance operon regulatory protein